jgi:glycosyltransferase involved in cell wall biosynthesis
MNAWQLLAFPRDPNPYQEDLYRAMRNQGLSVKYAGQLTGSASLNLLLLPVELAVGRARNVRVLHVHWTFGFALPFAERSRWLRILSQLWYTAILHSARRLGIRVVWTSHNVLPHSQVFDNDLAARRTLIDIADLVIAHQEHTLFELQRLGLRPSRSIVIPHGLDPPPALLDLPPACEGAVRLLFFGKLEGYKGVEDLLVAMRDAPPELTLVVAGACDDGALRAHLTRAADRLGNRVELRFGHVPEAAIPELFVAASCCVLPFRAITTSGSALLAMASGRPVLIPDLPALDHLPSEAVLRYPAGVAGLGGALVGLAESDRETLVAVGARGRQFATEHSWSRVAAETRAALEALLDEQSTGGRVSAIRRQHGRGLVQMTRRRRRFANPLEPSGTAQDAETSTLSEGSGADVRTNDADAMNRCSRRRAWAGRR